jgi:hypothetical protein
MDNRYRIDTRKGSCFTSWEELRVQQPAPPIQPGRFKEPGLPEIDLSFIGPCGCDLQIYDNFGNRQPFSFGAKPARRLAAFLNAIADQMEGVSVALEPAEGGG